MHRNRTYRLWRIFSSCLSKSLIFATVLSVLFSSVGLAVYTHSCSISGSERFLFVNKHDTCGTDDHAVQEKTCCGLPIDFPEQNNTDNRLPHVLSTPCCSTQTDYIVLDIDTHTTKVETNHFVLSNLSFIATFPWSIQIVRYLSLYYLDSSHTIALIPFYQGRNMQSILQVYIL